MIIFSVKSKNQPRQWDEAYVFSTDIGFLSVCARDNVITALFFKKLSRSTDSPVCKEAAAEIRALLAGTLRTFSVPLIAYGTQFQIAVWRKISAIARGKIITYSQLASQAGYPQSARPAANACGANPLPLFIPCHRVISSDGSIGGYAPGVQKKRKLLALEGAFIAS